MKTSDSAGQLSILVAGRPITEYQHESNTFVEGRHGTEFEIEYKNETRHSVLVIPAVDGLSVLDGKTATPDSKGYIVKPWSSIRIPGWTLDGGTVAKFKFGDRDASYATKTVEQGAIVNSGVIGVLVYQEEEVVQPKVEHHHYFHPRPATPYTPTVFPPSWPHVQPWIAPRPPYTLSGIGGTTHGAISHSAGDIRARGSAATTTLSASAATVDSKTAQSFSMGTEFGSKTEFKTNEVKFKRGDLVRQLVIYYDSRQNLERRGIEVVRRETRYRSELPQAFSGLTGCQPPKDWRG